MKLTERQEEVVKATSGHYVVFAGPGCGKTHTITEKVFYLFENNIIPDPYGLLAVTFTDSAAREMRARLRIRGFNQWQRIFVRTFHSFCRHILSCYGSDIGIRENFEILEGREREAILDKLRRKYMLTYSPADLKFHYDRFKRQGKYSSHLGERYSADFRGAYAEYNQILREENKLDFGDLIALTVGLLQQSPLVGRLYSNFFRYIIVDEFQDTDNQQLELVYLLAKDAIGSTIVGDDDQSIFGFTGALRQNVFKIKNLLDSNEILLGQNFRSDEIIVEAAIKVIGFDPMSREKEIIAVSSERGKLFRYEFEDTEKEAYQVVQWIKDLLSENEISNFGEIAIITRVGYRVESIIQELGEADIPWFNRSRLKFQDSWETVLALATIELAHDPDSSQYLHKVLTGIEEGGLAFWLGEEDSFDIALRIRDLLKLQGENSSFLENVNEILRIAEIYKIIEKASPGTTDLERRIKNIERMVENIYSEAQQHRIGLLNVISRFMGHDAVQIITGHRSKGCEFDAVFFIGLEDDILPDYRAHDDEDKLAEERRIFYVGLTRARKAAFLTNAKLRRDVYGKIRRKKPSRFLDHIPSDYFTELQ
ncbi:MAG: ATP-dependent helicase [Candidatus Thorarchaeota archaeon]